MRTLNEILDKYNVSEKNGSSGNLKALKKTIEELEKLDKVLLLPCSKKAMLKDKTKNPSGEHRCWASLNNKDDELWKISKELLESDAVIFFSSVRWGQANMFYQKLIERLTWLENRHTTLGESNIIKDIQSGFICVGQNWKGIDVVDTQKRVHTYYGFRPNDNFYWNWQFTNKISDETQKSYKEAFPKFVEKFDLKDLI